MSSNHYLAYIEAAWTDPEYYEERCSVCDLKADCGVCAYRVVQTGIFGPFYHDYCNNPEVRRYHGL